MAVTPNYNWPVPVATDYVKDGWEAISDLGNAIDTTVAGLGSGLNLVTTQTFTTSSQVNVDNCFTSTYTNYKLLFNVTGSVASADNCNLRMRVGGVNSSTGYARQFLRGISSTASAGFDTLSETLIFDVASGGSSVAYVEVFSPAVAVNTRIMTNFNGRTATNNGYTGLFYTTHTVATAYDGFSLIPASGTITGSLWVYGYEKV